MKAIILIGLLATFVIEDVAAYRPKPIPNPTDASHQTTISDPKFNFNCPRCRGCQPNCDCTVTFYGHSVTWHPFPQPTEPAPNCPNCGSCESFAPIFCPKVVGACTDDDIYDKVFNSQINIQ